MHIFAVLLGLGLAVYALSADIPDGEAATMEESLKLLTIKQNALSARHVLEMNAVKKDIELLRQEIRSALHPDKQPTGKDTSTPLDTSSLEWAHQMDSIRTELGSLRSEIAGVRVELEEARAAQNESKAAELEAQLADALCQIENTDDATKYNSLEIDNMKKQIRVMHLELRMSFKAFNALSLNWGNSQMAPADPSQSVASHKFRHFRLLRKQMQALKRSHWKLNSMNDNMTDQLIHLQAKLESMSAENSIGPSPQVELLAKNQSIQKQMIQNITTDLGNFNKLHTSMLELLENMENLEKTVDTALPEFQKEISKLDVDMAQLNSHQSYIQNNQENIRQSVKAIAVSVSNLMDKVDADHALLQEQNQTINHLEHQSKVHFTRLADHISKTEAQHAVNESMDIDDMPELIGEMKDLKVVEKRYENIVEHLPESCDAIKTSSGNALIAPGPGKAVETYCDAGWTLVQSRYNGSVDFNQNYETYVDGFGNPDGEFWIGNEALHHLTCDNCSSARIQMVDIYGKAWEANYEVFRVDCAENGYRLFVEGFTGNASDALSFQNDMEFSTIDRDNDISNSNCAADYEGGWWFSHCQHANLNGKYELGLSWFDCEHNEWIAIAASRITLRTKDECK